jgi:hypothetical protein
MPCDSFKGMVAPPKRRLGGAVLTGAYKGISFFIRHFEGTLPPVLNFMAIEVYPLSTVEGQATSSWARKMFEAVALHLSIRYGNAHLDEEYRAKNMIEMRPEYGLSVRTSPRGFLGSIG